MSLRAMSHVMKFADCSATDYVLLLMIADSVNADHGNQFWMTAGNLAVKARVGRQKATEFLKEYVEKGWLQETTPTVIDGRPTGRPGRYRFLFPVFNEAVYDPEGKISGGVAGDDTGAVSNDTGVAPGDTKTQEEPNRTENEPAPSATGSQDAPQRMIDRPATERFDTSLPSYKLCAYFAAKWLEHTPDAKPNITKKWVDEADRLLRIDQRDKAEIKEIIDWMFTNHERPYYGNSCHAIPSFRKLYLKIRGEMWTAQKRTGGGALQSRPRGVQQQPQGAPVQFGTDGKVTEAYRIWEREQRAAMKADMIDEVGTDIEQMRADGRLPPWWDDV